MKISIISDEISYDFHTAWELAEQWGVNEFELRNLGPNRMPDHDPVWDDVVCHYIKEKGARITALSPGLFKLRRSDESAEFHVGERFEKSLRLAETFDCTRIIIFAFLCEDGETEENPPEEVLDILGRKADQAQAAGIELSVETSQRTFAANGAASRILMEKLKHPSVTLNWDPANSLNGGDTSQLNGYKEIRGLASQVHVKDTDGSNIVVVGQGKVDWVGQLKALSEDGFDGYLTLETHIKPRLTGTKACLDALRKVAAPYLK